MQACIAPSVLSFEMPSAVISNHLRGGSLIRKRSSQLRSTFVSGTVSGTEWASTLDGQISSFQLVVFRLLHAGGIVAVVMIRCIPPVDCCSMVLGIVTMVITVMMVMVMTTMMMMIVIADTTSTMTRHRRQRPIARGHHRLS